MRAGGSDRAHLARLRRTRDDDPLALELDPDELAAVELRLLAHGRVTLARALERGPVDADAEAEGEMPAEVGGDHGSRVRDARQETPQPTEPATPGRERRDVERQSRRVEKCVRGPDPARLVLEMAPVVEAG